MQDSPVSGGALGQRACPHLDHELDSADVQPARRDVCGDEHREAPVAEARQRRLALRLRDVAVQRARADDLAQRGCGGG